MKSLLTPYGSYGSSYYHDLFYIASTESGMYSGLVAFSGYNCCVVGSLQQVMEEMIMDKSVVTAAQMQKLGFSKYESKAYLKLLENFPINGYMLSKYSGVPRSRIYEVLENLQDKKMVFKQQENNHTLYSPVEPEVFLQGVKAEYQTIFSQIATFTKAVYKKKKADENLFVINGRKNIFDFINTLIGAAVKRIAISVWEDDFDDLRAELNNALKRGVELRGIYFGNNVPFDSLVPHRRLSRYTAEKHERFITLVIDSTHTLSGVVSKDSASKVTWTRDQGFIEISEDFIAHDLVINLYSASLEGDEYKRFEQFTDTVHNFYYHYSDKDFKTYKNLL